MKPTTILVPLDGSALAEAALPYAVDLHGDRPGTRLVLLRAVDPRLPGVADPGAQRGLVEAAEGYLAAQPVPDRGLHVAPEARQPTGHGLVRGVGRRRDGRPCIGA